MHEAGGDFYDVLQPGEGVTDYLVADVSGHDLASALPTAALKALLHQNCSITESPEQALRTVNAVLRTVLPDGHFATLVYARVNRVRKRTTLVSAGHPPAIHAARAPACRCDRPGRGRDRSLRPRRIRAAGRRGGAGRPVVPLQRRPGAARAGRDAGPAGETALCALSMAAATVRCAEAVASMIDGAMAGREARDDIVLMGVEV